MKLFDKIYLAITEDSKINWIKQNNLKFDYSPILSSPNRYNEDDLFFVDNKLNTETLIFEDVYKKHIFKNFIDVVKQSDAINVISINEMKMLFKSVLNPIKHEIDIILFKFNFSDEKYFIDKISQIFGKKEFEKNEFFFLDKIYKPLLTTKGCCWRISETKMMMFLNIENLNELTIMHECIHYFQAVTEKSILHQETKLEKENKLVFNKSEIIVYVNEFCHILDGKFSHKEIMSGFEQILRERKLSISRNENISKNEFFKRCFNLTFLKNILNSTKEITPILFILTCIYENKYVNLIKAHLNFYFKHI